MKCSNAEKLRLNLYDVINNCELSLATAFYVVKDFYRDLYNNYLTAVENEKQVNDEEETIILQYDVNNELNKKEE